MQQEKAQYMVELKRMRTTIKDLRDKEENNLETIEWACRAITITSHHDRVPSRSPGFAKSRPLATKATRPRPL